KDAMRIRRRWSRSSILDFSFRFLGQECSGFFPPLPAGQSNGINTRAFMTPVKIWLGYPYPLGATWLGSGVNFALFSETAASVDLCLFDNVDAPQENMRIPVTEHTDQVWHV